jgi:pyruvate,orthophosphate dikinase
MLVYFFGNGKAEGTREMRAVLGGKGANLAEMTNSPVRRGSRSRSVCVDYLRGGTFRRRQTGRQTSPG